MSGTYKAIPIAALLRDGPTADPSTGPRHSLTEADVIIALDGASQAEFVVFGRAFMREAANTGRGQAAQVLAVSLDQQTGDLDKLAALVRAVKGRVEDDYRSPAPPPRSY